MPPRKTNPKDFTGHQKVKLAEQHHEELLKRRDTIAMQEQLDRESLDIPIVVGEDGREVFQGEAPEPPVEVVTKNIEPEWREMRVNTDLEHVTIGYGTDYTFREGQKYRVQNHVFKHLDRLGYVWH